MLSPTTLTMLVALVGIASYVQTLTGFAFSLVFMSAITVTGVVGIDDGAAIATLLMLVNAALILASERRFVSKAVFLPVVSPASVGTIIGALLLPVLLAISVEWLKFALGFVVILSSLRLLRIPKGAGERPSPFVFPLFGLAGGIMGGLFAVPGPPIVYALQVYLAEQRQIRATLVAIFAAVGFTRLVFSPLPTSSLLLATLLLVPATIAATEAARRWPPPLSPRSAQLLTVLLLILTGFILILPALTQSV